ncbi:MAG: class I SAM-dependent methyltransferase [Cyclobacteriaceae bacterium]
MKTELAPICLFVFNRPIHTKLTLDSLAHNYLSDQSELIVFSDGPRNHNISDVQLIDQVRSMVRSEDRFRKVTLVERQDNHGLACSVELGVSSVLEKFDKIIVLEDDLLTSVGFLTFMNEALDLYENENRVYHIAANIFPSVIPLRKNLFYDEASCWGWGTWRRAWKHYITDTKHLIQKLQESPRFDKFDRRRGYISQLEANREGRLRTWAIKWHTSIFLKQGLCLHPNKRLVKNIGFGENSTHTKRVPAGYKPKLAERIEVVRIPLRESKRVYLALRLHFVILKMKMKIMRLIKVYSRILAFLVRKKSEITYIFRNGLDSHKYVKHIHIGGWLTDHEAKTLYETMKLISSGISNIRAVEIGSWLGKSTYILAKSMKDNAGKGEILAIDPFNAEGDLESEIQYSRIASTVSKKLDLYSKFKDNMTDLGVWDLITVKRGFSYEIRLQLELKLDLVFIDGNHNFDAVEKDWLDWSVLVKKGGIVMFHDVEFEKKSEITGEIFYGPGQVIQKYVIDNREWEKVQHTDGLYVVRKLVN